MYFSTEQGIRYHLYLTDGTDYLPEAPFSHLVQLVGFRQSTPIVESSGIDRLVRNTIIDGIYTYFDQNPDLILAYVCDMMDGRQRARSQLFDSWYQEAESAYCKLSYTDNSTIYCGMLFRADHPYRTELEESVAEYIRQKVD